MTFTILHSGMKVSRPIKADLPTDPLAFAQDAYVASMVAGTIVIETADGIAPADGASDATVPAGVLLADLAGSSSVNNSALASGLAPVMLGNSEGVTTNYVDGETIAAGDPLYIGSGANAGKLTKVLPVAAGSYTSPVALALSAASPAAPELQIRIL